MIDINGRLHSTEKNVNVVAGADEILDDTKNKKQSDINTETYALVNEINAKLATLSPEQQSALSVATKANKNEANLGYYVCDTEANVAAKIVANATGYMLAAGGSIKIKMNNTNDVTNATLNINSTGGRLLYYNGKIASATNTWEAGETVEVYFDGDNYYANNVSNGGKFSTGEKISDVGIDDEPTADSENLVKSGGVQNELALGAVYDVSAKNPTAGPNNNGKWESLSALLSDVNLNTLIPTAVRRGGMGIKFIQSSDNKYVQYRLMATSFSTTEADWQGVDENITEDSQNLAKSGAVKNYVDSIDILNRSDEKNAFYVVDKHGYIVAKIDNNGLSVIDVKVKENNAFVSLLTKIYNLELQVDTIDKSAVLKDSSTENILKEDSDEFAIIDVRGYVAFWIDKYGNIKSNQKGDKDIKNDLVRQNVITPAIGTYGQNNAVYKISNLSKTFRVAFNFTVNDNLNVTGTNLPIITIVGSQTKQVSTIHAVPTDLNVERNGETYTAVSQMIGYNSGFNICGTNVVRTPSTKRPIVGDTAFAIWLKGNFDEESDFPSAQEVAERATWLGQHSSAQIVFTNDTFTVQGITSSDISVSIKDGSAYKTLGAFYDNLVTALGDYFDFKKMRLSASKTTEDLLQFGTLKLVSNYYQQTNKASTSLSYNYDSFPVSIPLAIDESLHTADIVYTNNKVYVSIDGDFIFYNDSNVSELYIGGTSLASGLVTCKNLEFNKDSLGDALIDNTYGIVSDRSPRVIGVMQHLIEDKYEGETLTQAYYSSVSRMLDVFRMLENRGYTIISLNDVCQWLSGRKKLPARSIFYLATTNPTYDNFLNDMISRRIWTSASVPLIIGSIINTDQTTAGGTDNLFKQVVSARAIGVEYITHLYDHDVIPDYKNSLILQQELYKLIRLCIASGIDTRVYSYGWSCLSVNYFNMLNLNGFIGAMGGGNYTNNATTQYQIGRVNIADKMSISNLSNILI